MRRGAGLVVASLLLLAACHRRQADAPVPGADAEARTAAKARADIEAAERAASTPIAPGLDRAVAPVRVSPDAEGALLPDEEVSEDAGNGAASQ